MRNEAIGLMTWFVKEWSFKRSRFVEVTHGGEMIRKVLVLTYFAQNITSDLSISVSLWFFLPFFHVKESSHLPPSPFSQYHPALQNGYMLKYVSFLFTQEAFYNKTQWSFYNLFIYQIIHPFIGCFNKTNVTKPNHTYEEIKFAYLWYKVKYWTIYIDCSILQRLFY